MKNLFILFILLISLLPPSASAEKGNEEVLTLLNQPQKNATPQQQLQPNGQLQELRDIHGPVELQKQSRILIYATIITLLLLLLFAIALYIKKRKKPMPAPVPPWETALAELSQARELLSSNLALHYMNRVSLILRNYVESRFAIKSTRQTTREFLSDLNKSSTDRAIRSCRVELQTCLEQCDKAKFAHQVPPQQKMETMENAIITFIEKTRPNPDTKGGTP